MIHSLITRSEEDLPEKLRQVGIPLLILILSAGLGWFASRERAIIVTALVIGLAALQALLRYPHWGHLLIIIFSIVLPLHIPTGTRIYLNLTYVLCWACLAGWLVRMLIEEKRIRLAPTTTALPALGFVGALTIALVGGNIRWIINAPEGAPFDIQLAGFSLYLVCIGTFFLFANQITRLAWLRKLTWSFLAVGGVYILFRMLGVNSLNRTLFVPGQHLGSVFWIFLVSLAYGQLIYNSGLSPARRFLLGALVACTFYVAMIRNNAWYSGWMPPLAAVAVITWLRFRALRPLFIIGGVILLLFASANIFGFFESTSRQFTFYSRMATYPILFNLIEANPITGLGIANYRFYTPLYPILGWHVQFNSHNNYMDIIAQAGLLGLAFFVWFVFEIARTGLRLRSTVKDGFSQGYVASALGGLAAMLLSGLLGDWFLPFIFNVGISGYRAAVFGWIFLAGLVALENIKPNTMEKAQ